MELTDAQQEEQTKRQRADERAKGQAFVDRAGKAWRFHYAGGTTEIYKTTGLNEERMPTFPNGAGTTVRLTVTNDDTVTMIGDG